MKVLHYAFLLLIVFTVGTLQQYQQYQQYRQYQQYQPYEQQPQPQGQQYQSYNQNAQYAQAAQQQQAQQAQVASEQNMAVADAAAQQAAGQPAESVQPSEPGQPTEPGQQVYQPAYPANQSIPGDIGEQEPYGIQDNMTIPDGDMYNQTELEGPASSGPPAKARGPGEAPPKDPKKNPLTYSLSFFMFDTKKMIGKLSHKKPKSIKAHKVQQQGKTNTTANHTTIADHHNVNTTALGKAKELKSDDHAQNNATKESTVPQCHHCAKNSSYEQCISAQTVKACEESTQSRCFARSHMKNGTVHYEMGCATHRQCRKAKTKCKAHSKACFTCCGSDKCNSAPHHDEQITRFMAQENDAGRQGVQWVMVALLLGACLTLVL